MTIGVTGCSSGIGVTHLSIAICSFCASKLGKKTAFIEFHGRNELSQLFPESDPESDTDRPQYFHLRGIDYYPNVNSSHIPSLLNMGYHYLIFDMGSFMEADFQELLRCDRKLILGSSAPWKRRTWEALFSYINDRVSSGDGFYYLVQAGSAKSILSFSKSFQVSKRSVLQIPFIKNPFCIEKELFLFFQELLA